MNTRTRRDQFGSPWRFLGDLGALAFPRRHWISGGLLALLAAPALAPAESALDRAKKRAAEPDILFERDVCGAVLKSPLAGPPVAADDLPGRCVLVILGGPDNAKWNDFMVRMGMQYIRAAPPGGVVPLFIVPPGKTDCAWWTAGGGSPLATFFTEETASLPGLTFTGGPRYLFFDGDGKLVGDICHDGRDLTGGSVHVYAGARFTPEGIRRAVDATSGAIVKEGVYTACAEDARRLAEAGAVSAPILPVLSALQAKARDGKGAARGEAAALLAGVREYYEKQAALVERNLAVHPFLASRAAQRCAVQTRGDRELGPRFEKLAARLRADRAFQAELKPAEMLYAVRAQAAQVRWGLLDPDYPPRPKETVQAIRRGLEEILRSHARSRAAQTAERLKQAYTDWAAKAIDPTPW